MKVVITGGSGFLGQQLGRALLRRGSLTGLSGQQERIDSLVLFDTTAPRDIGWHDDRVSVVLGDIADPGTVSSLCDRADIAVFHTASVLSGGSEEHFDQAWRVNVEGARNVLEALRHLPGQPRLVFTSTLAVFGGHFLESPVGAATKQAPETTYGATKAIVELLVNDYTRKGFVDGRTARLPTVIVRPEAPNSAASSFTSSVVRETYRGSDVVLPVPLNTPMAVIGHRTVIECLVRAHEQPDQLGPDRAIQLPSITVTPAELVASLQLLAGNRALGTVSFAPDPVVARIVSGWPTATDSTEARPRSAGRYRCRLSGALLHRRLRLSGSGNGDAGPGRHMGRLAIGKAVGRGVVYARPGVVMNKPPGFMRG